MGLVLLSALLLAALNCKAELPFEWPVVKPIPFPPIPRADEVPNLCYKNWSQDQPYAVVTPPGRHDASWLQSLRSDTKAYFYQPHNPQGQNFFHEDANEGGAYLQYIIDYYDCLPEAVAFVHGHKSAWHSCNFVNSFSHLNWSAIPGYASLARRPEFSWTWALKARTTPHRLVRGPVSSDEDVYSGKYWPQDIINGDAYDRVNAMDDLQSQMDVKAYDHFFGRAGFGPLPDYITWMCCGQFAVTREAIRGRPRQFYVQALHFARYNEIVVMDPGWRRRIVGDIFTHFWHMMFGKHPTWTNGEEVSDDILFPGAPLSGDCNAE